MVLMREKGREILSRDLWSDSAAFVSEGERNRKGMN